MEAINPLIQAMAQRIHSLILGTKVPVQVKQVPWTDPPEEPGLALELLSDKQRVLALWLNPNETWSKLRSAWSNEATHDTKLSYFCMGGLQTLFSLSSTLGEASDRDSHSGTASTSNKRGEISISGSPEPGVSEQSGSPSQPGQAQQFGQHGPSSNLALSFISSQIWSADDTLMWRSLMDSMVWLGILSPAGRSWLGLNKDWARSLDTGLRGHLAFVESVKQDVLGLACGRQGMETAWTRSRRGALNLDDTFPFGPCLLPVLKSSDRVHVPQFKFANPDPVDFETSSTFLVHSIGWEGLTFDLIYRVELPNTPPTPEDILASFTRVLENAPSLIPFGNLLDQEQDHDEWSIVQGLSGSAQEWLEIVAEYPDLNETWHILMPGPLLNDLSTLGRDPWNWRILHSSADNLLELFASAVRRHSFHSPTGKGLREPGTWVLEWWKTLQKEARVGTSTKLGGLVTPGEGDEEEAPELLDDSMLTVADLLTIGTQVDATIITQNILVPTTTLHPLNGLFYWGIFDPDSGLTAYRIPHFNHERFKAMLPDAHKERFDKLVLSTRQDLLAKNLQALDLIWQSFKNKGFDFSPRLVRTLKDGYLAPLRRGRERLAREVSKPSMALIIGAAAPHPQVTASIQRLGDTAIAHALLYDPDAEKSLLKLCSKAFKEEYHSRRMQLLASLSLEGPDPQRIKTERLALSLEMEKLASLLKEKR